MTQPAVLQSTTVCSFEKDQVPLGQVTLFAAAPQLKSLALSRLPATKVLAVEDAQYCVLTGELRPEQLSLVVVLETLVLVAHTLCRGQLSTEPFAVPEYW